MKLFIKETLILTLKRLPTSILSIIGFIIGIMIGIRWFK